MEAQTRPRICFLSRPVAQEPLRFESEKLVVGSLGGTFQREVATYNKW
jgi:hypothetical protein